MYHLFTLLLLFRSASSTTGTSVLGIRYDSGVMLAADTLVSYGSMARYQNIERVFKVNKNILLGGSGDFADIQSIKRNIDQKMIEDQCCDDNIEMKPKSLASWMTRVLYNRRSRMNPLYIDVVVGGVDNEGTRTWPTWISVDDPTRTTWWPLVLPAIWPFRWSVRRSPRTGTLPP